MGYKIRYDKACKGEARRAINDLISYIGIRRTILLIRYAPKVSMMQFEVAASFAGVQGFPVESLWKYSQKKK